MDQSVTVDQYIAALVAYARAQGRRRLRARVLAVVALGLVLTIAGLALRSVL